MLKKRTFINRSLGCGVRILDFWTMELSLLEGDEGLVAAQVVSCCVSKIKNIEETEDYRYLVNVAKSIQVQMGQMGLVSSGPW